MTDLRRGPHIIKPGIKRPGGMGERISYFLRAFYKNITDGGYTDGQVINTMEEGCDIGQLTVVEKDGTLAAASDKAAFTAQATADWADLGVYSGAITKALGRTFFGTGNVGATNKNAYILNASDSATVDMSGGGGNKVYAFLFNSNTKLRAYYTATLFAEFGAYSASTDYEFAIVHGGYDSNGVPWKSGDTASSFLYGAKFYVKGGAFSAWTLLYSTPEDNTSTLYAVLSNYDATGTLNNLIAPDYDFSPVLQPDFLETFSGSGSIDAGTPDVDTSGNGWTQRVSDADWRYDTGKGELTTAGSDPANNAKERFAWFDVGVSDGEFEADVKYDSGAAGANGIIFRTSAETANGLNIWRYILSAGGDEELTQVEDGAVTKRANAAHGAVNGTFYKLKVIINGTTITCYRDGAQKLQYTSATFNQTATRMGIRADSRKLTDKAFDNVAVWPRTDTTKYDRTFAGGTESLY